jgi:hypothetical protein
MKSFIHIFLACVFGLSTVAQSSGPTIPDETEEEMRAITPEESLRFMEWVKNNDNTRSGKITFYQLMQIPDVRERYHELQREYLSSETDLHIQNIYQENPVLRSMFEQIEKIHAQSLDHMIEIFDLQNDDAGINVTEQQKMINEIVVRVMIKLGFSEKAIKNRKIYIVEGEMNAATVSANNDKVIIIINKGLIEKFTPGEIEWVIGHEAGHVIEKHSAYRIANMMMFQWIFDHLASPEPGAGVIIGRKNPTTGESQAFFERQMTIAKDNAPIEELIRQSNQQYFNERFAGLSHKHQGLQQNMVSHFSEMNLQLIELAHSFNRVPFENMKQAIQTFIQGIAQGMAASDGNPEIAKYFETISENFEDIAFKKLNRTQLMIALEPTISTLIRMGERSADNIPASETRNIVGASGFGKMMGAESSPSDPQGKPLPLPREVVMRYYNKAVSFLNRYPPEQRHLFNNGSHPLTALRIYSILNTPKNPTIIFANYVTRVLLLEREMSMDLARLKLQIEKYDLMTDPSVKKPAVMSRLNQIKNKMESNLNKVSTKVMKMLSYQVENSVEQPRLKNLVQLYMMTKDRLVFERKALVEELQKLQKKPAAVKPMITEIQSALRELNVIERDLNEYLLRIQVLVKGKLAELGKLKQKTASSEKQTLALQKINEWLERGRAANQSEELLKIQREATQRADGVTPEQRIPIRELLPAPASTKKSSASKKSKVGATAGRCEFAFGPFTK